MTSDEDPEVCRPKWRRTLKHHRLHEDAGTDLATGSLAARLREPTVQMLLLPPEPEAVVIEFDDFFWSWLEQQRVQTVEGHPVALGDLAVPTAHAAALASRNNPGDPWNHYLAVHRSGAIEAGLGTRGAWPHGRQGEEPPKVFNLITIVAYTAALLRFAVALDERHPTGEPRQLTVALRDTERALLGNVGAGWDEPRPVGSIDSLCPDPAVLWHLELVGALDKASPDQVAAAVGNRLEDAWGYRQRRYLARRGPAKGHLDIEQVRQ